MDANNLNGSRIRIVDIAEELGVSTATVSNVIHGKTDKVSSETLKRVEAKLEEKEYVPSMAGILLAQNNSQIVGVVINNHEKYEGRILEDPFIASAINYLSSEIEKQNLFMMIKTTTDYKEIDRFATMWNLVGLVLIGFCEQDYDLLRSKMRIPFVVYDGQFSETENRICNISIDDYDGGYQVGKYLATSGHSKILCIADNEESMDLKRINGFRDAAARHGAMGEFMRVPITARERETVYEMQLDRLKLFTGIFVVSDIYAIELMRFLQEHGIRVPEDISIVGYDDMPLCTQVVPKLTTVKQNQELRAKNAVETLIKLSDKVGVPSEIKLPVKLIVRDSSKCI